MELPQPSLAEQIRIIRGEAARLFIAEELLKQRAASMPRQTTGPIFLPALPSYPLHGRAAGDRAHKAWKQRRRTSGHGGRR